MKTRPERAVRSGAHARAAATRSPRLRTWSNGLTALRLLAALPLYHALVAGAWGLACIVFWLAVASDWVDGRLARARGESSALGGLFDHASDASFVVAGLSALVVAGQAPGPLPFLVVLAFVQYVLDSRILAGRPLRGSALGRWNGILYFVPIGIIVTRESLGFTWPSDDQVLWLGRALVLTTLVSMSHRAWALIETRRRPPR